MIEKYWGKHSESFIFGDTVALGMGILDENVLFCHGTSEKNRDRKIILRYYNWVAVYDWFINPFKLYGRILALDIPHVSIDDRPCPNKKSGCNSDPLPDTIYIVYK